MQPSSAYPVLLFSYGTLQDKAVQLANFGRELSGQADRMLGYRQDWVEITDPAVLAASGKSHHPIVTPSSQADDSVAGMRRLIEGFTLADSGTFRRYNGEAIAW